MSVLPEHIDDTMYWQEVYAQPLVFWEPALAWVTTLHRRPSDSWVRAPLGRNVVFLSSTTVIKFGPPCWAGDMAREAAALTFVAGRLPVVTPVVVAEGRIDGWDYLIQERLPGVSLWDIWPKLDPAAQVDLAEQHGRLMAALHALPIDTVSDCLHFDWPRMITAQFATCATAMQTSGVNTHSVAQVNPYLAPVVPLLMNEMPHVLLHGDLTHLNFLVAEEQGRWRINGLIDWGDVKIGPRTHEFISPGVHMYRGDRVALEAWYRGYGLAVDERSVQLEHLIMARAMLYYADEFSSYMRAAPGAMEGHDWPSIAQRFWHLRA